VTGGTGFVGRYLVDRLVAEGYIVRLLSRRSNTIASDAVEEFYGDLLDADTDLAAFLDDVDALFHCAGEVRDKSRMQALNVDAVSRLLDEARGRKLHWIQLSSVGVYGATWNGTVTEDTLLTPANAYERSKAAADEMLMAVTDDESMAWTILRPANVYGEGMSSRGLSRFVDAVRTGLYRPIGDGKANAHYIHVENVVDALLLCLQDTRAIRRIYNISDTNRMVDCAGIIAKYYNKPLNLSAVPEWLVRGVAGLAAIVPGLPVNFSTVDVLVNKTNYSRSRIEAELGYRLRVPINKGLNRFLAWKERERV